jgi:CBS domain-containing protein
MRSKKIKTLMTKDVITADEGDTLKDVIQKLVKHDISGMPVLDKDNKIVGMISEKDILKALKTESRTLSMVFPSSHALGMTFEESVDYRELKEAMKDLQNSKIKKIMTTNVITVKENITLAEAANIMITNNINRIPVIKKDKLVGIVTRGDLLTGLSKVK